MMTAAAEHKNTGSSGADAEIATSPSSPPARRRVTRACDGCKLRKVKCDNLVPSCTRCRSIGLDCLYEVPERKRGPRKGPRRQYEASRTSSFNSSTSPWSSLSGAEVTRVPRRPVTPQEPSGVPQRPTIILPQPFPDPEPYREMRIDTAAHLRHNNRRSSHTGIGHFSPLSSVTIDIAEHLLSTLDCDVAGLRRLANKCLDIYATYVYPNIPLVSVRHLKNDAESIYEQLGRRSSARPASPRPRMSEDAGYSSGQEETTSTELDAAFVVLTALCALIAVVEGEKVTGHGDASRIATAFFSASRDSLRVDLLADLRNPRITTIIILYFHCFYYHNQAKDESPALSLGVARSLCWLLQLQDENTYKGLDPWEAEARRRCYWQVAHSDISAGYLGGVPISMREICLQDEITVELPRQDFDLFAPNDSSALDSDAEQPSVMPGFNLCQCLWRAADEVVQAIDLLRRYKKHSRIPIATTDLLRIEEMYFSFLTVLDRAPSALQLTFSASAERAAESLETMQDIHIAIQRANLRVTYHFLHMVIQERLADLLSNISPSTPCDTMRMFGGSMQVLKKVEIAREMVQVIRNTPQEVLKANGEHCVEKIRRIGVALLEIIKEGEEGPLVERAKGDLSVLLDVLAGLDSRACDSLIG